MGEDISGIKLPLSIRSLVTELLIYFSFSAFGWNLPAFFIRLDGLRGGLMSLIGSSAGLVFFIDASLLALVSSCDFTGCVFGKCFT